MQHIVVIDDSPITLEVCKRMLARLSGVDVHGFVSPTVALPWACENAADLIVVDYQMPEMDGVEFIERFRKVSHDQAVPIVVLTGHGETEIRRRALELGASDFLQKPADPTEFLARARNLLRMRKAERELGRQADALRQELSEKTGLVTGHERAMLASLVRTASYHDADGMDHGARLADYAEMMARKLQMGRDFRQVISAAAPLHDLGKVAIPDVILRKKGKLSRDEFELMKTHSRIGYDILAGCTSPVMKTAGDIALGHHERWDGRGYPQGLKGDAIPLSARIIAVADVFDALVSVRAYKGAWPLPEALAAIRRESGEAFDPTIAQAFLASELDIGEIRQRHAVKAA